MFLRCVTTTPCARSDASMRAGRVLAVGVTTTRRSCGQLRFRCFAGPATSRVQRAELPLQRHRPPVPSGGQPGRTGRRSPFTRSPGQPLAREGGTNYPHGASPQSTFSFRRATSSISCCRLENWRCRCLSVPVRRILASGALTISAAVVLSAANNETFAVSSVSSKAKTRHSGRAGAERAGRGGGAGRGLHDAGMVLAWCFEGSCKVLHGGLRWPTVGMHLHQRQLRQPSPAARQRLKTGLQRAALARCRGRWLVQALAVLVAVAVEVARLSPSSTAVRPTCPRCAQARQQVQVLAQACGVCQGRGPGHGGPAHGADQVAGHGAAQGFCRCGTRPRATAQPRS